MRLLIGRVEAGAIAGAEAVIILIDQDAPPGQPSLTRAWMSEVAVEEYEAEFVDTVADCMGAGLSLQDALTCWDTGHLALDDAEDSEAGNADDESTPYILPVPRRRPTGGHRLLVR